MTEPSSTKGKDSPEALLRERGEALRRVGQVEQRCICLSERIRHLSAEREQTPELVSALVRARDVMARAIRRRKRRLMLADLDAAEQILAGAL